MRQQRVLLSIVLPFTLVAAGALLPGCSDDPVGETCGNGVVGTGEFCDGQDLNSATCQSENQGTGTLACNTDCTFDYSGCTADTCGDGVVNGSDECDGADLDSQDCTDHGFDTGTLACSGTCTYDTTGCEHDTCGDDAIQGNEACDGADLNNQTCADHNFDAGTLACAANCGAFDTSGCCNSNCTTVDELRCNTNALEICSVTPAGCLVWTNQEDCAANGQICEVGTSGPECVTVGNTCATAQQITVAPNQPFSISGADLTAIYSDDHSWNNVGGPGECQTANGVEAIFTVDLNAGDVLWLSETGDISTVFRVLEVCDPAVATTCLFSPVGTESLFTAPATGSYFIVLEATMSASGIFPFDYNLTIELVAPEANCNDNVDNDHDSLIDCADSDCFGTASCAVELLCDDNADNDSDGDVDCADSDCTLASNCITYKGTYEDFGNSGGDNDLEGCSIVFTAATTPGDDYTHAVNCSGLAAYPITPGTGTVSSTPVLTADDFAAVSIGWSFNFFGIDYTSLFVGSNGFITFGAGDNSYSAFPLELFEQPRIAGLDMDLDPSLAGCTGASTVYVDEFADHVAVTYHEVCYWNGYGDPNSFQIVIRQNGSIELHFLDIGVYDEGYVGVMNGASQGTFPAEIDYKQPVQIFFSDMETDPSWVIGPGIGSTGPVWEWGVPAYTSSFPYPTGCADGSAGCYGTRMDNRYSSHMDYDTHYIQVGPVDLSGASSAVNLVFDMWLHTEDGFDYAQVQVSTDGVTFSPLAITAPAYNDTDQWTGEIATTWTEVTANLGAYQSSTVYLRFALDSDYNGTRCGFYVDNVAIWD